MQTFLPHPLFTDCARALDDRRLGKQRVETLQLLRALVWPRYGWQNHPAAVMWRGFVPALVGYGTAVCRQWRSRGNADAVLPALLEFTGGRVPEERWLRERDLLPPWLGEEALHRSHRSALLRKEPEHYRGVFANVTEDLEYLWPGSVFPKGWICRPSMAPMEVAEALELMAWPDADRRFTAVVERLARGHDADVGVGDPDDARRVGLLAGLCTPGPTLWLWPGAPTPEPPEPPPASTAGVDAGPVGRVAASKARPIGPEERAAMCAAAGAPAGFHFRRVVAGSVPGQPPPEGTGLVVVGARGALAPPGDAGVLRLTTG